MAKTDAMLLPAGTRQKRDELRAASGLRPNHLLKKKAQRPTPTIMNSTVTAIVSTYNSERFFTSRMENLLQQTIADRLEIVVVDSGSEQNEGKIAQQYISSGAAVKLIRTERETLYSAWNRAIEVASGDFLISANTDDRLMPDACEVMSAALDADRQVALVFSDAWETTDEQEVIDCTVLSYSHGRRRIKRPAYSHVRLLVECCCGPFPMWRKSLHQDLGLFDSSYQVAGDWEFWLRIGENSRMLHIAEPLGLMARRPDSVLWRDQELWKQENSRVRAKYFGSAMKQPRIRSISPPVDHSSTLLK